MGLSLRVSLRVGLRVSLRVSLRVRVRRFDISGEHKWVLCGSVAEGGGRGSASGLWLEGWLHLGSKP